MQLIEINEPEFPNELIYDTINLILKSESLDEVNLSEKSNKWMIIGDLMIMGIGEINLLNSIVETLKSHGFFMRNKEFQTMIIGLVNKPEIDADLAVRIQSICYGILLRYESYLKFFARHENLYFPSLKVEINKSWVKCNLDEVIDEVNGGRIIGIKNEIEKFPLNIRKDKYKEVLRIMGAINVDHNTDELKKHFERLTILKENLPDEIKKPVSKAVENYKNTIWFKVGILYATIDMESLIEKFKIPLKVAEHLGFPKYEKCILATMNNYIGYNSSKNIYHNRKRMEQIIQHCKDNNMEVRSHFISKLPAEQT